MKIYYEKQENEKVLKEDSMVLLGGRSLKIYGMDHTRSSSKYLM